MFTSTQLLKLYMSISNSVTRLVNAYQLLQDAASKDKQKLADVLAANADLQAQLTVELGNNPAEQAAIEKAVADTKTAYAIADEAKAQADKYSLEITKLQATIDADSTEDAQLDALINSVLPVEIAVEVKPEMINEVVTEASVVEAVQTTEPVAEAAEAVEPAEVVEPTA